MRSSHEVLAHALAEAASEFLAEALTDLEHGADPDCGRLGALDEVRLRLTVLERIGGRLAEIADAADERASR